MIDTQKDAEEIAAVMYKHCCKNSGDNCDFKNCDKCIGEALAEANFGSIDRARKDGIAIVLKDLKGLLEGYVYRETKETLYAFYCRKYGVEDK